jgi:hypothetical protein
MISGNNRPDREKYEWQRAQTECEMRHKMEKKYCFRGVASNRADGTTSNSSDRSVNNFRNYSLIENDQSGRFSGNWLFSTITGITKH